MNSWLFFTVMAPLMWSIANVLDSGIRRHFIKCDLTFTWLTSINRLPFVILFFWLGGYHFPGVYPLVMMLLAGVVWIAPFWLYYKALEFEEPSRLSLMLQVIPIFTLLMAFFVLGETLTPVQTFAFAVLILGGALAGIKRLEGKIHFSKATILMLTATFFWALSDVLFKKFEPFFDSFYAAFAVSIFGSFLFGFVVLFIPRLRRKILTPFRHVSARGWSLVIASSTLGVIGSLSFSYALTIGKASLTAVILGVQPLLVFGLGLILQPLIPEAHKEDISKKALLFKGLSFALVMCGLILLRIKTGL